MGKLNPKHEKFIQNILSGMTQAEAYIAAGYSPKTARQNGHRLITNEYVRGEIERRLDEVKQAAKVHLEQESLKAARTLTGLLDGGTKEDFCRLYAAKDVLDRTGLKAEEKVQHTGEIKVVKEIVTADKISGE